jgi:hypothetical protein
LFFRFGPTPRTGAAQGGTQDACGRVVLEPRRYPLGWPKKEARRARRRAIGGRARSAGPGLFSRSRRQPLGDWETSDPAKAGCLGAIAVDWPAGMTSPPGSAGIPFGRERSDLEAPRAGEERATAPHRVGGAGPQPRPRSRDPCHYPQATQPPLVRHNPDAPANARSRAAGRTGGAGAEGNRPTGGRGGPLARNLPQPPTRRGDCWTAQAGVCGERSREPMDGARPQRSRSELASEDGAVKGLAPVTPTSTRR